MGKTVANRAHGQNGAFIRTVETAERDGEACRLRSLGRSYQEIADTLGFSDPSNARRAVLRKLAETGSEHSEAARQLELQRIDRGLAVVFETMDDPGPLVDRLGRVVRSEDGEPQPDRMVRLAAVDRLARLLDRRARVLGTDAPKRSVSLTGSLDEISQALASISEADLDAYIAAKAREARRLAAEAEAGEAGHGEVVQVRALPE